MPPTISVTRSGLRASARSSAVGSIQSVSGSTSTKTGVASKYVTTSAVAAKVRVGTATPWPRRTPSAASARWSAAAQGGILEQADDVRGGLLEIAWRCEQTALPAPHDLAITLDAPGDHRDVRRHRLQEAAGDALLPGEEHRHVHVRKQRAHVLAVADELGRRGDAELRGHPLALGAERAVADQAEPRPRTGGVDPGEHVQQVVMVPHRFEAGDAGHDAPGAGVRACEASEALHVDAIADQARPDAAPPPNEAQVLAVRHEQ